MKKLKIVSFVLLTLSIFVSNSYADVYGDDSAQIIKEATQRILANNVNKVLSIDGVEIVSKKNFDRHTLPNLRNPKVITVKYKATYLMSSQDFTNEIRNTSAYVLPMGDIYSMMFWGHFLEVHNGFTKGQTKTLTQEFICGNNFESKKLEMKGYGTVGHVIF